MIRHYKNIFLIRIHSFDDLVLQERILFPPFSLESKFIHKIGQNWVLMIISVLFVIMHDKHILLIWIHDFDALVLQEMFFFPPFSLESNFIPQNGQTWILIVIYILLGIRHSKSIFLFGIHGFDALVLQETLFFPRSSIESSLSLKLDNLDSHNNLHSYSDWTL